MFYNCQVLIILESVVILTFWYIDSDSYQVILSYHSFTNQVNILQHASGSIEGEGFTELTVLRMAVTNSVVDPWIYILFRKEVLMIILRAIERVRGRSLQITHDLSGISETADTKQVSTVMSSTNRTAESQLSDDDGGVYKG